MTTFLDRIQGAGAGRSLPGERPISTWAFLGVAITSFGGPLALAAVYAPGIVADTASSAGLAMIAAIVVFAIPLVIWLRYAGQISSPGGLFAFTEAAAGRRIALVQGGLWIFSYALYLLYTTAAIVYDTLPAVFPGVTRYQRLLEIAIPVAMTGVMIAGRWVTMLVIGIMGAGQLALAAALGGLTVANLGAPASSFGASAPAGSVAAATGQTALLYICGSLPLFLGGEIASPARTMRRGLAGVFLATGLVMTMAVAPLAAAPFFAKTAIPGMTVARAYGGHAFAIAIGTGVAVSIAGVMIVEYVGLSRLIPAMTSLSRRQVIIGIGALTISFAPITLINPDRIYDDLLKPSLVALWLSQLIVFAVYPLFIRRQRGRMLPAWALAAASCAFAIYGLVATLQHSGGS